MKQLKFFLLSGLAITAFTLQANAQEPILPEVTVMAKNYKYTRSVDSKDLAQPVKLLERKAAAYDVKNSEFYDDEYDTYHISFYLPSGYVLAVYDQDGNLLRTAERFKNIDLPAAVRNAVIKRYPNWNISDDLYKVKYSEQEGSEMFYKIVLQNGNKRLRVRTDEQGKFLD